MSSRRLGSTTLVLSSRWRAESVKGADEALTSEVAPRDERPFGCGGDDQGVDNMKRVTSESAPHPAPVKYLLGTFRPNFQCSSHQRGPRWTRPADLGEGQALGRDRQRNCDGPPLAPQ